MIELKHVSKTYGTKKALKDLSLTIQQGEIFGFLGHNGAGKSTTIKSLVSILQPTSGEIVFDGKALAQYREEIKKTDCLCPGFTGHVFAVDRRRILGFDRSCL